MLKCELSKALRDIDDKFADIKRSIPKHILEMKMKEIEDYSSFDEIILDEKMSNLNATLKDTVQKADEGENRSILILFMCFMFLIDVLIEDSTVQSFL